MQGMVRNAVSKLAVRDCWVHSRATALIAEWFAPLYRVQPDQAYTVALMHDIGRLAMLSAYPEYEALLTTTTGGNTDMLEAEKRALSVNHCEAGMWLTRIWGLPDEFWDSAAHHHEPITGTPGDRLDLVRLSCLLAQSLDFRAASHIDCEPAESLIARIPEAASSSLASIPELSEHLRQVIQADGSEAL
jgi:putative nucleotidyltransferase with HDIG domain